MKTGPKIIILGLGIALITLGVVVLVLFPRVIEKKIRAQIRLEEGGDLFSRWKDIPIPIFMKVYMFNITNPEELALGEKPNLQEVGPYIYRQKRQKVVEHIDLEKDTVRYRPKFTYYFRRDLSVGGEDDLINFINIPLVSVSAQFLDASNVKRYLINEVISNHEDEEPLFTQRSVGEVLFKGYFEPMIAELGEYSGEELMPNNTFGIYFGKNGTAQDVLEIYSGVIDNDKFGQTISWKGQSKLNFWETEYCNMMNGSDGSIFPPFVSRDRVVEIFSPDMCRSIYMTYTQDVELLGIPAYRFSTPKQVLEDPTKFKENMCYCTKPGKDNEGCNKAGAFQLAACRKGAPIVASWPHFYDGDEAYVNQSIGLHPDKERHETFISLEPNTGALLQASKRFQINVQLKPNKYIKGMKRVPSMVLPILWVDESVMLNEENAEMIKGKLLTPMKVASISTFGALGLGATLIVIAIGLMFLPNKNNKISGSGNDTGNNVIAWNGSDKIEVNRQNVTIPEPKWSDVKI